MRANYAIYFVVQSTVPGYPQFNERVQLSCKTGYTKTGIRILNGSDWSITVPVCERGMSSLIAIFDVLYFAIFFEQNHP